MLGDTMKKLQVFASTKHGMQMMYLIAFVVFVFFVTFVMNLFRDIRFDDASMVPTGRFILLA